MSEGSLLNQVRIQTEDFDLTTEVARLRAANPKIGAVVTFVGAVRDLNDGASVAEMELEHYPGMTEQSIAGQGEQLDADAWQARWTALPPLGGDYDKALQGRFAAGVTALEAGRESYTRQLEANRAKLLDEVLRLEIVAGVDSGAEFARERLKMQVEVLQSSLKSGQKPLSATAAYLQLCAMPALADDRTVSRIEQLLRRIGGSERA